MQDAHRRRFDVVCVWRFDRFARSVSHLLRALETFKVLGIDFVSFSEQMDTSTPAGKMVFTVLGAVADLERSLIVERVKAGMRNARAKGRCVGRPPQIQLSPEMRASIAGAYAGGATSLRALAKKPRGRHRVPMILRNTPLWLYFRSVRSSEKSVKL